MAGRERTINTYKISIIGILSAQAIILSMLESFIVIPGLPQGVKPGLSNIIVMYSLGTLGVTPSIIIAIIKAAFAGVTRGTMSFILSLTGGLASILIMFILIKIFKNNNGILGISIAGAVSHNLAQLLVVSLMTYMKTFIAYSPVLIFSGLVMGLLTGVLYKAVTPLLQKWLVHIKGKSEK